MTATTAIARHQNRQSGHGLFEVCNAERGRLGELWHWAVNIVGTLYRLGEFGLRVIVLDSRSSQHDIGTLPIAGRNQVLAKVPFV